MELHVKTVVAKVPDIVDYNKTSGEEADPYVVALALKLVDEGNEVTVVTDDRKDTPVKTSLASACGVLRIPVISARVLLRELQIWKSPT